MKSKKLYKYLGIILIAVPILGLYQYLKNSIYIIIGLILVINSLDKKMSVKSDNYLPPIKKLIRRSTGIKEEKER